MAYSFGLLRGKRLVETWGILLYDLHRWDYAFIVSQLCFDFNRFEKRGLAQRKNFTKRYC